MESKKKGLWADVEFTGLNHSGNLKLFVFASDLVSFKTVWPVVKGQSKFIATYLKTLLL